MQVLTPSSAPLSGPGDPAVFGPSVPGAVQSLAAPLPVAFPSGREVVLASHASPPPSWIPGSLVRLVADAVALKAPVGRKDNAEAQHLRI